MALCNVCFRRCDIGDGQTGFCGARVGRGGRVEAGNYGRITSIAIDPIEKKPLRRFRPGEMILSVGSYGCNLRCPFCQNNSISWSDQALALGEGSDHGRTAAGQERILQLTPRRLAGLSLQYQDEGSIGVAFTYNEPLVGYEFVRDAAQLIRENGQVNVMVTNGTASLPVLEELLPLIDAMNIDLKGFTDRYYTDILGGSRKMVMEFIARAAEDCHVELTTLIVPGENDSEEEMRQLSKWVAGLDPLIPLHITRFFPQFHMTDRPPTEVGRIFRLAEVAREQLRYVYEGNC